MGELRIVKLRFTSALHLGTDVPGIGIEDSLSIAHSDTVFSCLINAYAELHSGDPKAVDKLLAPFCMKESLRFGFRRRSRSKGVTQMDVRYYLPKPLVDPPRVFMIP